MLVNQIIEVCMYISKDAGIVPMQKTMHFMYAAYPRGAHEHSDQPMHAAVHAFCKHLSMGQVQAVHINILMNRLI